MLTSDPSSPSLRLVIDRDALARNYHRLCAAAPGAETAAVVKADAYGLGAPAIAMRLAREGCRTFFVATPEEGADLRLALGGSEADIWVFNGYRAPWRDAYLQHRLGAILNHPGDLHAFAAAPAGACALHLDTGMNRLGFSLEDAQALIRDGLPEGLDLRLIMSHLACSEDAAHPLNARQRERFAALAAKLPKARLSLANTGGVMLGPDYHFDMTRPGIGLYGAAGDPDAAHDFEPAARLEASILQIRELQPGDTVGYGAAFTAPHAMTAAIISAGYADGLPRALSGAGFARVDGRRAAILGRVSMDLIAIDVSACADAARAGAPAEFLGPDIAAAARAANTLPYELLTGIGPRAARCYEGAS